jgi:hypothetical protein
MPGSTLASADGPYCPNSTYTAANISANTSQRRPRTSRSGRSSRSARSASPLFARWARRHQRHGHDAHESNDSRSSTDRKSTSSGGNPNNQAGVTQTYNFSTSTLRRSGSSSKRQSQSGLPPPLTREEFEALPLAIQRKVRFLLFCHTRTTYSQLAGHVCGR